MQSTVVFMSTWCSWLWSLWCSLWQWSSWQWSLWHLMNAVHCCLYINLVFMVVVMLIIMISDGSDDDHHYIWWQWRWWHGQFVTERRVLMWFSHLLSCFKFPNGNVESAERPCNCKTYKTGPRHARSLFFSLKSLNFHRHLSCQCRHCSGRPWGVPEGDPAMGESSQLPSRPGFILMITMMRITTFTIMLMTMLNLFFPDTLQKLQHGEGRVWGAIVWPARELEQM